MAIEIAADPRIAHEARKVAGGGYEIEHRITSISRSMRAICASLRFGFEIHKWKCGTCSMEGCPVQPRGHCGSNVMTPPLTRLHYVHMSGIGKDYRVPPGIGQYDAF